MFIKSRKYDDDFLFLLRILLPYLGWRKLQKLFNLSNSQVNYLQNDLKVSGKLFTCSDCKKFIRFTPIVIIKDRSKFSEDLRELKDEIKSVT